MTFSAFSRRAPSHPHSAGASYRFITPLRALLLLILTSSALLTACGDEEPPAPKLDLEAPVLPFSETSLKQTRSGEGPGHWDRTTRAAAIDESDYVVISSAKDEIEGAFGTLVINIPLIDKRTREDCLSGERGQEALPASTVPELLAGIADRGLSFDRVVVQVELFDPQREDLHRLCLSSGASKPSYYLNEVRDLVINALSDLARVSEIDAIVVGLELNTYAQLTAEVSYDRSWDYLNLIDLYQEVYAAVKAQNDQILVGPSVSWPSFQLDTIPSVAERFKTDPSALLTLELALRESIWPLLWDGERASADFVGVALFARPADPPYQGTPLPEDEAAVRDFYRELPQIGAHPKLSEPLPIAITSMDWATKNEASGGLKTDYLIGLKSALSHVSPEWVAWRRLSMIPETPPETSACRSIENRGYGKDECYAGLLDINGQPRSVWDEFIKSPE